MFLTTSTLVVRTANPLLVCRSKEYAWIPATVVSIEGDKAEVSIPQFADEQDIQSDGGKKAKSYLRKTIDLKSYPAKSLPLQNTDRNGFLRQVDDMVDLSFLHEVSFNIG